MSWGGKVTDPHDLTLCSSSLLHPLSRSRAALRSEAIEAAGCRVAVQSLLRAQAGRSLQSRLSRGHSFSPTSGWTDKRRRVSCFDLCPPVDTRSLCAVRCPLEVPLDRSAECVSASDRPASPGYYYHRVTSSSARPPAVSSRLRVSVSLCGDGSPAASLMVSASCQEGQSTPEMQIGFQNFVSPKKFDSDLDLCVLANIFLNIFRRGISTELTRKLG